MEKVSKETANVRDKVTHDLNSTSLNPSEPQTTDIKPATSSQSAVQDIVAQVRDISIDAKKKDDPLLKPEAAIALIYANVFPPPVKYGKTSVFAPSSMHMYDIVSYMDTCIVDNDYYFQLGYPWHPIISRWYFGYLFYYQTLRAGAQAKILTPNQLAILTSLESELPPSSLPIPGPLIPVYRALTACESQSPNGDIICPTLCG